jgi:hypothetical protein
MKTKTKKEKEKTIAMFHISGGGGNSRKVTFQGFKKITDCYDWDMHCFLKNEDEEGNLLPEDEWTIVGDSGNEIMDAEEYNVAMTEGIGTLNFDEDYDTTYSKYLDDISEDELRTIISEGAAADFQKEEALTVYISQGYDEDKKVEDIEIAAKLALRFKDVDYLLSDNDPEHYIKNNYDISDEAPDGDYLKIGDKYYAEA